MRYSFYDISNKSKVPYVLLFNYGIMNPNSIELKVFRGLKQAARQTTHRERRYGSTHS
jgi:hypothetical protein